MARRRKARARRKGRSAAQKRAFRKMLAGLRRYKAGKKRRPSGGKKRRRARRARAAAPATAITKRRRRRRRITKGAETMPKRRRRRRHRRAVARRRNPSTISNPRRRRRFRRRRNPGTGGIVGHVKTAARAAIPAIAAGAASGLIEAKFLAGRSLPVQVLAKLGLAAGAGMILRSKPEAAKYAMGAILGTLGSVVAARVAGGFIAPNKTEAMKALQMLIYEDPAAMSALVSADGTINTVPSLSAPYADVNLG